MQYVVLPRYVGLVYVHITFNVRPPEPELIEPSARVVFIFWTLVEREERGTSEERGKHGSNLARLKTAASEQKETVDPQPLSVDVSIRSRRKLVDTM